MPDPLSFRVGEDGFDDLELARIAEASKLWDAVFTALTPKAPVTLRAVPDEARELLDRAIDDASGRTDRPSA